MFRRAILSLVVATLIAPPGILGGQVQRMAIPAGAFDLAAGAAQAVETFCLDLTRASPKSGSEYREILTAPEHAQVIIGDQTVSLQDALSQGLVTIEGQDLQLPVSELLDELQDPLVFRRVAADLSPDERRDLSELVTGWGQLGKEDRAKAAEQLGTMPLGGDHTHLRFVNKTPHQMRIVIDEAAVVGSEKEAIDGLSLESIRSPNSTDDQRHLQRDVWVGNDRENQRLLSYLGYYGGPLDGESGPRTLRGLVTFQRDHELAATSQFDAPTVAALQEVGEARRLQGINDATSGLLSATVHNRPSDQARRYVVMIGETDVVYAGNDPADLTRALNQRLEDKSSSTLYLDLSGFSEAKADALGRTIRIQQRQLDGAVDVFPMPRIDGSPELQDALFARGVRFERRGVPVVEEITSGPNRGWFRTTLDFSVRIGKAIKHVTIQIWSASRDVAQLAYEFVVSKLAPGTFDETRSIASLVREARSEIRRRHPELKRDDIRIELRDQVGGTYIVRLRSRKLPDDHGSA